MLFGAVILGFAINDIYFLKPKPLAETRTIMIPSGASVSDISRILAEEKLISSRVLFLTYARLRKLDRSLKAGTFEIPLELNQRAIFRMLTAESDQEITITFIEGWTLREIAETLRANGIPEADFYAIAGTPPAPASDQQPSADFSEDFSFLKIKPNASSLEGFLFPDTYRFFADASAEAVVRKMLKNFEMKGARACTDCPEISYDDLILASIIEREVRSDEDRRKVADLFLRRLKIGMALQADSTVNYVTGKDTPALSSADRNLDHPYNTYLNRGLPPGPISNPSFSSIDAVRNPEPNPYWFFLTDKEGNVHFARTLAEHNQNKAKYLR